MKKLSLLLICNLFVSLLCLGQVPKQISGTITTPDGEAIPNVTVVIKGTTKGVAAGADGKFTINVDKFPMMLQFSFIGFEDKLVGFNAPTKTAKIVMEESSMALDEVVVVGYGTLKKSEMTTAVSSIGEEELKSQVFTSFEQALQGKVSGVSVIEDSGEPGAGISVSIRGTNSVSGGGEPLYVIDGIPINMGSVAGGGGSNSSARDNPLAFLNPNDIQSMEVLKDAAATSIYGSRGSNGVIVVTTKQAQEGKLRVDFTAKFSYQMVDDVFDLMDARQFATVKNDMLLLTDPSLRDNYEAWYNKPTFWKGDANSAQPHPDNAIHTTDFVDKITQAALMQNYQINISGGQKNGNTQLLSFGYTNQTGNIIESGMERYNLKTILKQKILPRFTLTTNLSFNYTKNKKQGVGGAATDNGLFFDCMRISPTTRLNADDDSLDEDGNFARNPYTEAKNTKNISINKDLLGSVEGLVDLGKGFNVTLRVSGSMRMSNRDTFYPFTTRSGHDNRGQGIYQENYNTNLSSENFVSYNKLINKIHSLNLVAGVSYEAAQSKGMGVTMKNFGFDEFGTDNFTIANQWQSTNSSKETTTLQSGFIRLNYALNKKYLFNFTGRVDGSSKFGSNNKWGYFPAGSVAWQIAQEKFMKNVKWVNNAKLRFSYGIVGNQALPNYNSLYTYSLGRIIFNDAQYSAATPTRLNNPDLKWESTESFNCGLDLTLFERKFSFTADYYKKTTRDLLMNLSLPPSSGYTTYRTNMGSISNEGLELEFLVYPVNKQNFKWNTRMNFSRNVSKLVSLGGQQRLSTAVVSPNVFADQSHELFVGKELGLFYGYHAIGLIQFDDFSEYTGTKKTIKKGADGYPVFTPTSPNQALLGRVKYDDVNRDGVFSDEDKSVMGKANPDFTIGWTNNFTIYKNWEVNIFMQAAVGFQLLNVTGGYLNGGRASDNASKELFRKRWTFENQHNDSRYPSFGGGNEQYIISDNLIEDGDYLRIKSVSIRYNVPSKFMKKLGLASGSIYCTGTNLFTLTKYSGNDPEVNSRPGGLTPGVDFAPYPRPKVYTLGISLSF